MYHHGGLALFDYCSIEKLFYEECVLPRGTKSIALAKHTPRSAHRSRKLLLALSVFGLVTLGCGTAANVQEALATPVPTSAPGPQISGEGANNPEPDVYLAIPTPDPDGVEINGILIPCYERMKLGDKLYLKRDANASVYGDTGMRSVFERFCTEHYSPEASED